MASLPTPGDSISWPIEEEYDIESIGVKKREGERKSRKREGGREKKKDWKKGTRGRRNNDNSTVNFIFKNASLLS